MFDDDSTSAERVSTLSRALDVYITVFPRFGSGLDLSFWEVGTSPDVMLLLFRGAFFGSLCNP